MTKPALGLTLASLLALATSGCDKGSSSLVPIVGSPGDLQITVRHETSGLNGAADRVDMPVGDSAALKALALNAIGLPLGRVAPDWSSSNPDVARVAADGKLTAGNPGVALILASHSGKTDSLMAHVGSLEKGVVPPAANIIAPSRDTTVTVDDPVRFEGNATDANGEVVSHRWDFGDGGTASVQDPGEYAYTTQGLYTVTYRVTDDEGAESVPDTVTINVVAAGNQAPTASIVSPGGSVGVTLGNAVNFQGSASDADGSIVSYRWDFGDGSTASVKDPGAYTYTAVGVYTVTFQVTDNDGAVSLPQSVVVTVSSGSTSTPTVEWNMDWSDATGTSRSAVWDLAQPQPVTGGWNDLGSDPVTDGIRVVDAASAHCDYSGIPGGGPANVLQTPHGAGGTMGFEPSDGYLSTPAIGEARYYRMLVCLRWTGGEQTLHDISDDGGRPALQYNHNANVSPGLETRSTHWQMTLWYTDTGSSDQFERSSFKLQRNLSLDTPYWLEWSTHIVSLSPDSIHSHVRITNAITGLVEADDDDFLSVKQSLGLTLADSIPVAVQNSIISVNGFQFGGANGWDNPGSGVHHEYGAIAICSGTWCGTSYPLPGER